MLGFLVDGHILLRAALVVANKLKMTSLVASSSGQDSQEHEVSQRGYESPYYFIFSRDSSRI